MGQYNKHVTISPSVYNAGADAFVIGNGSSDTTRTNAFRVSFEGQVFGAGAYTTGGADYAGVAGILSLLTSVAGLPELKA